MPHPYPVFDDSDPVGAALNLIVEAIKSNEITDVVGGLLLEGPFGKTLQVTRGGSQRNIVTRIEIPAGGIADGASANCRYYVADHTLSGVSETIEVWNRSGGSVGGVAAKIGYAAWINQESELQVIQERC